MPRVTKNSDDPCATCACGPDGESIACEHCEPRGKHWEPDGWRCDGGCGRGMGLELLNKSC
jgi:hypothetical protein